MPLATIRLLALAFIIGALAAGCGRSSDSVSPPSSGTETVTFRVKDMGKRLALM